METENKLNDEKIRKANFELGRPQDAAPSNDVANKAEDDSSNAPATTTTNQNIDEEFEHEYISGLKLFLVIMAITLVVFVMTLDMSIIVTVRPAIFHPYASTFSKN
jgi:uncharacterized membrane protein